MTRSPIPAPDGTILAPWHSDPPASSTPKPTSPLRPSPRPSPSKTSAAPSTSSSTSPRPSPAPSTSPSNGPTTAAPHSHPPKPPTPSPNSPPSASSSTSSPSRRPPTASVTSSPPPPTSPSPSPNSSPRGRRLATIAGAVLLSLATNVSVALAHTRVEVDELIAELHAELIYRIEVIYDSGINAGLLKWWRTELDAIEALYTPTSRSPTVGEAAAAWRPLIATYFPAYLVEEALAVVWCESKGNPTAYNTSSGASGLFQHLPKYWSSRSSKAGVPGADIMDPTANVLVAAWLVRTSLEADIGPWAHWTCRP